MADGQLKHQDGPVTVFAGRPTKVQNESVSVLADRLIEAQNKSVTVLADRPSTPSGLQPLLQVSDHYFRSVTVLAGRQEEGSQMVRNIALDRMEQGQDSPKTPTQLLTNMDEQTAGVEVTPIDGSSNLMSEEESLDGSGDGAKLPTTSTPND
jgi:hypothetical protein